MSLESKIEALTAAVIALTAKLESNNVAPVAPVVITSVAPAAPQTVTVQPAPAPVAPPAPVAVAMPAPPTFMAAPAPVAAAPVGAPFSDPKGLITYVMSAYTALGPQKGAQIQGVLTSLGYQNINDVKPEHYGQLFAGVEALKG
jgi:hypothetical protein